MAARRHGLVDIKWADGEYPFRLGLGQLRELQEKTNCGPLELFKRLGAGTWRVDDVYETIRIGLIGGGKKPTEALGLVQRYVLERPLVESVQVAQVIIMTCLYGDLEEKPAGETDRRGGESGQTVGSPSPRSTAAVQ